MTSCRGHRVHRSVDAEPAGKKSSIHDQPGSICQGTAVVALRIACFFLAEIEFFLEETALFELGRRRAAGGKLVKASEPASSSANTPSMRIGMSCGAAANQLASLKKWQNGGHLPRIGGRRVHRSVDAVAAGGKKASIS
jgi:hypothetical protein